MIPYKTSKDYERLKELLDEGKEIVIFYCPRLDDKKYVKCTLSKKIKIWNVHLYDIGSFDIYYWHLKKKPFEDWCEMYNVEFIEPNL